MAPSTSISADARVELIDFHANVLVSLAASPSASARIRKFESMVTKMVGVPFESRTSMAVCRMA